MFRSTPVDVAGLSDVASISLGYSHSCALMSDRSVKCWGWNDYAQLGDGMKTNSSTPVDVKSLSRVQAIGMASDYSCALIESNDSVKCWGANNSGRLGDGEPHESNDTPTAVRATDNPNDGDLGNVGALSVGVAHSCALMKSEKTWVKCWGINDYGQLGNGESGTGKLSATPVDVKGLPGSPQ